MEKCMTKALQGNTSSLSCSYVVLGSAGHRGLVLLYDMTVLLYHLPLASMCSLSVLVNHPLHLPDISIWIFPLFSYILAYLKKMIVSTHV
jgi:hypothetical protein